MPSSGLKTQAKREVRAREPLPVTLPGLFRRGAKRRGIAKCHWPSSPHHHQHHHCEIQTQLRPMPVLRGLPRPLAPMRPPRKRAGVLFISELPKPKQQNQTPLFISELPKPKQQNQTPQRGVCGFVSEGLICLPSFLDPATAIGSSALCKFAHSW